MILPQPDPSTGDVILQITPVRHSNGKWYQFNRHEDTKYYTARSHDDMHKALDEILKSMDQVVR